MAQPMLSRRTFLGVAALGTAALVAGCDYTSIPAASPYNRGPEVTRRLILGETFGLPGGMPSSFVRTSLSLSKPPNQVLASVYYPYNNDPTHVIDNRIPTPNPLQMTHGPFPVLLFAHAFRAHIENGGSHTLERDFTSLDGILQHVCSYGCVAVVPDLSWTPLEVDSEAWDVRAAVLEGYLAYLETLNTSLFAQQLDLSRLVMVGHSTGAGGATHAGREILAARHPTALAYGLLAPAEGGDSGADLQNVLVIGGSLDNQQGARPAIAYTKSGGPKTLAMIPGANHYGYTDICAPDNACGTGANLIDGDGAISRDNQQRSAAAYFAALVRYYMQGDQTARPYLSGERKIEGLEGIGVQLHSQGLGRSAQQGP